MIEAFRLKKKFREEVEEWAKTSGKVMNEFQVEQETMMRLQQHMMKNNPHPMMAQPSTEQQKAIQLQMLAHMKRELAAPQPEFAKRIEELETKLTAGDLTPIEVNLAMRTIQQELMAKKMQEIIKQRGETGKTEPASRERIKGEDESETLKKEEEIAD